MILDPAAVKIDPGTKLGSGAFGVVRAGTLYGSTPVAIKELEHCSGNVAEALQQEVERMMRVAHPNVVRVYGLLCTKNSKTPSAIVMERLGATLEDAAIQTDLTPEYKMQYTQDIIAGMGRVHEGRMVHCDLKPQNILLTENGHHAVIIDFGVSQGKSTIIADSLLDRRTSRGTIQYMAPEVSEAGKLGLSCDVYSFGVLLYELWSEQKAWEGYSEDQIRTNVRGEIRPATLDRMREEQIPEPIIALIEACWKQKPADRPTFKEMQAILEIEDFWETNPTRWPSFLQPAPSPARLFSAEELERYNTERARARAARRMAANIAAQEAFLRQESTQRALIDSENTELYKAILQQRTASPALLVSLSALRPAQTVRTQAIAKELFSGGVDPGYGLGRSDIPELEWELGRGNSRPMNFQQAQAYAATRAAEGWRLPTIWELYGLYQQRATLGNDLHSGWFWSVTELEDRFDARWRVNFADGVVSGYIATGGAWVRLVRSSQKKFTEQ